jgi:hypothetical protein
MPSSRRLRFGAILLVAGAAVGGGIVASTSGIAVGADAAIDINSAAVASARAVRSKPPTTPPTTPPTDHFVTLAVGATLPTDDYCRTHVRAAAEVRSSNVTANHTTGSSSVGRVTGGFTGTTDEIIQWAACKWGIDEDIVRAQIVKESYWRQDAGGDPTNDQTLCPPALRTTSGMCPESAGLGQIRYQYHPDAFANNNAVKSSAFNLDYTYSLWRNCFEGNETWLNTVERGKNYTAGDAWGCVGLWFSGRWYTAAANTYIAAVQGIMANREWAQPGFPQ